MNTLTPKENEVLLALFKDFSKDYNANSISKRAGITPRGALKILQHLKKLNLVLSKPFGKAVFYKVNLDDYYTLRVMETLLMAESREKAPRWLSEFQELFKEVEIGLIFGSITRQPKEAKDIDLLLVFPQKKMKSVKNYIQEKNKILLKPIHPLMQSPEDIKNNLKKKDPVILSALSTGYVLSGYEQLLEVVKSVTSF